MAVQRVRPFVAGDISQVAALHRRQFRLDEEDTPELELSYRSFFHEVYLGNPWYDPGLSPLICEDGDGRIIGFLGVMPRPMRLDGRPIRAAVSSMFMVDPSQRPGLAAVQLLKAFFSGPQDLSFADESTGFSRRIWERLGGAASPLYSMYWTRPLRPARFLNLQLSRCRGLGAAAKMLAPFAWAADAVVGQVKSNPFRCPAPRLAGENTDAHTLLECLGSACDQRALRPEYDEPSLRWSLELAGHGGALQKIAVRNSSGNVIGWYVYYLSREGIAEVLQIGSHRDFTKDVVDHLLAHAERQGAVAVTGRVDPRYMDDLGARCVMRLRYWMLVHSQNPELLSMATRGLRSLTRLEGEWCMQFHVSRYRRPALENPPATVEALADPLWENPPAAVEAMADSISVKAETGGIEVVDSLADEWRRLCDEGCCREPFYRPEWTAAYIRAFEPGEKVLVVTARSGGVLRAALPLIEKRSRLWGVRVTTLRGAANAHSCRFDLVRSPGAEGDAAVLAVWRFLRELPGWDLIELPDVPEGGAIEQLAGAALLDGFPVGRNESMRCPYVPLDACGSGMDPLLLQTSAGFRSNVRRKTRRIESRGTLALRRFHVADPALLQAFYDLERSGWKGKQGTAIACHEDTRQFYDEIARQGEQYGYLSLSFLDFEGHPIAAQFGIVYGGRYFMPKLAFDEDYRPYGPGHLLIHAILRDCAAEGLCEYDFTGPWAEYKAKWTSLSRSHSTLTVFRKGVKGWLLHAAKFKVEASVRRLLHPLADTARKSRAWPAPPVV